MNTCVDLIQLALINVAAGYHGVPVVKDLNLTLGNGQIGCLLGPSGCGKSTLLRAIAGFEPVLAGEILMENQCLSALGTTQPPERRHVGMVFQDLALFPHLSVEQNIAFGLQQWSPPERTQRVDALLALVGLEAMRERYPHSLSGGQQQRVALARGMAPRPKLLLLDEPFSGLDAAMREQLVPEVRDILLQEQMSALLVTHDQMEAFAIADKVAIMKEGRILQCDTAYNIYHEPNNRYVANFIGEGDFLSGIVLDDKRVQSALGILSVERPHNFAVHQPVDILVRPDDLLHDDDSPITAKIISKQFRGSHFLYRVVLPSQQALYCFASSHHNHALGEQIGIKLDLDHLVMFAQQA
ncbi:MAG: ABC transporter ATP-binding protein [Cellvibrionaceae bacterium]|nr:ABC transporter ATP-binding protein [Cellvibrionaceae bacterium]